RPAALPHQTHPRQTPVRTRMANTKRTAGGNGSRGDILSVVSGQWCGVVQVGTTVNGQLPNPRVIKREAGDQEERKRGEKQQVRVEQVRKWSGSDREAHCNQMRLNHGWHR